MSYAVLQGSDLAPSAEQLTEAFKTTDRLVDIDARRLARDALCILARGLDRGEAGAIASALRRHGVEAAVVDEAELFELPPPIKLKRAAAHPDRLELFDALGRPSAMPWDELLVVAAGVVPHQESERRTTARTIHNSEGSFVVSDVDYREVTADRMVLELIANAEPSRYRVMAHEFIDATPGVAPPRSSGDRLDRFGGFIEAVVAHTRVAVFNRGVMAMGRGDDQVASYGSRRAFEEEIVWLIWWSSRSGAAT